MNPRLLLDNNSARVLETKIEPGEMVKLHTQGWPAAYDFLATGDFMRRGEHGAVVINSRELTHRARAGQSAWSPPLGPHTLENVGTALTHVISVEIKTPLAS